MMAVDIVHHVIAKSNYPNLAPKKIVGTFRSQARAAGRVRELADEQSKAIALREATLAATADLAEESRAAFEAFVAAEDGASDRMDAADRRLESARRAFL